jgi:mannose-6-phosphate isomerase-like protein (cupin superfamily)
MRDSYQPGVLDTRVRSASEIAARDEFNRQHPPLTGLVVPHDLRKMELPERAWRNNRGHWFDLADYEVLSAHLSELKPGDCSVRHRHTTEAYLYIVKGNGYSVVNYEGEREQVVEWSEGTLLAPPRWAWHQHFNLDENDTSRYLAIQDTGLLRTMRLHQIERHAVQLTPAEGAVLLAAAANQAAATNTAATNSTAVDRAAADPGRAG